MPCPALKLHKDNRVWSVWIIHEAPAIVAQRAQCYCCMYLVMRTLHCPRLWMGRFTPPPIHYKQFTLHVSTCSRTFPPFVRVTICLNQTVPLWYNTHCSLHVYTSCTLIHRVQGWPTSVKKWKTAVFVNNFVKSMTCGSESLCKKPIKLL